MWGWMKSKTAQFFAACFAVLLEFFWTKAKENRETKIHEPQPGRDAQLRRKLRDQRRRAYDGMQADPNRQSDNTDTAGQGPSDPVR